MNSDSFNNTTIVQPSEDFARFIETHLEVVKSVRRAVTYDALVLDARLRQSLVTIRSLGRQRLYVAAAELSSLLQTSPYVPAFSSRYCQHSYITPTYERDKEAFSSYLRRFLEHTGARVLIASSDGTLAVLRAHRAEFERYTRVALAKEEALAVAANKKLTLEVAQRLDIDVPRGIVIRSMDEVSPAIREIRLPAVVKPVESWVWTNGDYNGRQGVRLLCQLVTKRDEARKAIEELIQCAGSVLLQQFLPGRREAVSFLYANGAMAARFAQWTRRTQPPLGGTSVYRQSIALPQDIAEQAERLIREIELEGYSELEFRRDGYGNPYLMEINPGLSASVEVAVRAGVDFPFMLYRWACGETLQPVEGYHTGRWMRYLEGDLLTTIQSLKQQGLPGVPSSLRAIAEFVAAFCIPADYDYLDWHDPLPARIAALDFCHRVLHFPKQKQPARELWYANRPVQ